MHILVLSIVLLSCILLSYKIGQRSAKRTQDNEDGEVQKEEAKAEEQPEAPADTSIDIKAEFIKGLTSINALIRPEDDEKKTVVVFEYQSETFVAYTYEKSYRIDIYDYGWEKVDCEQLEEFSLYRKAVNDVNKIACVTIYYEIVKDDDDDKLYANICSQREIFFWGVNKDTKDYLTCVLRTFFETQHKFGQQLVKREEVAD